MSQVDLHYTLSVIERASDALALGRGDLKTRLLSAMISLTPLDVKDFPSDLQARYEALVETCTRNPSKTITIVREGHVYTEQSGTLMATIPYMRWVTVDKVAREIIAIESQLRFELYGDVYR